MEDLHNIGGIPAVIKMLLDEGLLNGECMNVTGRTLRENVQDLPGLKTGQTIVQPRSQPLKENGHIQILKGNLAPEGAVAKFAVFRSGKSVRLRRRHASCAGARDD
jgi:dihydroxy-acid dehydratase